MADTIYETVARFYDKDMKEPLRRRLVGRQLFANVVTLPPGSYNYDYKTITDLGDAIISGELPLDEQQSDVVALTTNNLKLATINRKYKIARSTFQAMLKAGYGIDAVNMRSAAYKVAKKDDTLLIQGWTGDDTNYVLSGLYQSAGNDYSTTADFATAGKAISAVAGAWALLEADDVEGYNMNLTLNPTQYHELMASVLSSGAMEAPVVLDQLNPYKDAPLGVIRRSNAVTAATGLMSPVDPAGDCISLIVGQEPRNVIANEKFPGVSPIEAVVYEVVAPLIIHSVSCCKLSSI